jgi:hypothetical protein
VSEEDPAQSKAGAQALLAILQTSASEADCQRCLAQLDDYVAAQLEGAAQVSHFTWLAHHLDGCLECAAAYALLYETVLAEIRGGLPQPAVYPPPDLSFLRAPADWLASLRQALQAIPGGLALQLSATLNSLLQPQASPGLARSGESGRYGSPLLELTSEQAATAGLPFTLAAYGDRLHSDLCLLEVTVQPEGLSWPDLAGFTVTVTAGGQSIPAETDAWGTAVFPDIPLAELENLQLAISLTAGDDGSL